ncbi:penicillin-binding protein PbpC [Catenovulum agarivorans DS-2]|uniref:peptidoglycan glycosyltransferase n=1 Tax=Catenovulum agarivorans DS-2 TaxID=1328313 RepID=W7QAD5_9ALTE|nr:penicillin-binding protein 1C [Catenovulum agarivorans]EWH09764.1 penicillin-binding protein PbpC [Catenovulum agarivorans DS-2]
MKVIIQRYIKKLVVALVLLLFALKVLDLVFPLNLTKLTDSATVVTDRNGELLRAFSNKEYIWRFQVEQSSVSPYYLQALLTYEDRYFYYHPGVNPVALLRALWQGISSGKIVSGGSTLTMQLARLLHPHEKSLLGKSQQILRALQLEWHFDKTQILDMYLNLAPFGGVIEGVEAASLTYFDKKSLHLTKAEAALLAVLPQAPSRYRPDRHPDNAQQARNKLLDRMAEYSVWPQQQVDELKQLPVYADYFSQPQIAPLLSRRLRQQKQNQIETFIDKSLQQRLAFLTKQHVTQLGDEISAAVMVMHGLNGEVVSYIGSADFYSQKRKGQVDMISAIRSPGSTLKPFVYADAIESGLIHENSLLLDIPVVRGNYSPQNFLGGYSGPVTAKQALLKSLNIPVLQVVNHCSIKALTAKLENAGLKLIWPEHAEPNQALVLGGVGTQLESLVQLYSSLLNQGIAVIPRFGKEQALETRFAMQPGVAWIIQNILRQQQSNWQFEQQPIATSAIGWKTGTSYDFRDAWVIGFSGKYIIGVWVGRADAQPIFDNTGTQNALPLFMQIAKQVESDFKPTKPTSVSQADTCWPSGKQSQTTEEGSCLFKQQSWLYNLQAPPSMNHHTAGFNEALNIQYWLEPSGHRAYTSCASAQAQKVSQAVFPKSLNAWLPTEWKQENLLPKLSANCRNLSTSSSELLITSIQDQSRFIRRNATDSIQLELVTNEPNETIFWFLNDRPIVSDRLIINKAGQYNLVALAQSGMSDQVSFIVE